MENFLYTIKNAKEIKIVDINFDLYPHSLKTDTDDLLITYSSLPGIVYCYLFQDVPKKSILPEEFKIRKKII